MAKASTVTLSASVSGDGITAFSYIPTGAPVQNAAAAGELRSLALTTGFNTLTVPSATTTGFILVPPSGSTVSKTLKGITGDTGFALSMTAPSFISIPAGTATIAITVSGNETVQILWL